MVVCDGTADPAEGSYQEFSFVLSGREDQRFCSTHNGVSFREFHFDLRIPETLCLAALEDKIHGERGFFRQMELLIGESGRGDDHICPGGIHSADRNLCFADFQFAAAVEGNAKYRFFCIWGDDRRNSMIGKIRGDSGADDFVFLLDPRK